MSSPGDVVGVESCVDFRNNDDFAKHAESLTVVARSGHRSFTPAKMMKKLKEYPPPLSMSWEMKRYRTCDGRLIIREEKTHRRQHEIFRADRSNGRLTLHIVNSESEHDAVLGDQGVSQMDMRDEVSTVK